MVDFELRILPDLEVMMKEFWLKKRFSALTASVVMVAAVAISFLGWFLPRPEAAGPEMPFYNGYIQPLPLPSWPFPGR